MKHLTFFTLLVALFCTSCNTTTTAPSCEPFELQITHTYNNAPFYLNDLYTSPQNNQMWFTTKKYYLSNVFAVKEDGTKHLLSEIALINADTNENNVIAKNLETGKYKGLEFSLGVDSVLNVQDPTTWTPDHPLNVFNNMYWTWNTMYVFAKLEGFEVSNNDTIPFLIHTGTNNLYRSNIAVDLPFTVNSGSNSTVILEVDVLSILQQSGYTFNLTQDGQTHTMDNMPLAIQYMDNFTNALN